MKSKKKFKEPKKKKVEPIESTDGSYYADESYDDDGDWMNDDWSP